MFIVQGSSNDVPNCKHSLDIANAASPIIKRVRKEKKSIANSRSSVKLFFTDFCLNC